MDRMTLKSKVWEAGGSLAITIPKELAEYLQLTKGNIVELIDDKGKHGKFAAFWKQTEE